MWFVIKAVGWTYILQIDIFLSRHGFRISSRICKLLFESITFLFTNSHATFSKEVKLIHWFPNKYVITGLPLTVSGQWCPLVTRPIDANHSHFTTLKCNFCYNHMNLWFIRNRLDILVIPIALLHWNKMKIPPYVTFCRVNKDVKRQIHWDVQQCVATFTLRQCTLAGPVYNGMPLVDQVYTVVPLVTPVNTRMAHWNTTGETGKNLAGAKPLSEPMLEYC